MSENSNQEFEEVNVVTIIDDDGIEHLYEEIDRIETEDGNKYVAILEFIDDDEQILSIEDEESDENGVIILKVLEEDGENYLIQIETEKEYNEVGNIFEDRMIQRYEKELNDN